MPLSPGFATGWTGAAYSLFRAVFGLGLAVELARLLPWGRELYSRAGVLPDARVSPSLRVVPNVLGLSDAPAAVTALLVLAILASLALAAGFRDRIAAVFVWYALACLHGRNPLATSYGMPLLGWLLLAHGVAIPPAPYGAWDARGRLDPGGGWSFPSPLAAVAWIVLTATRLPPLVPFVFFTRLRPWLWLGLLAWSVADPVRSGFGLLMLQAFTFDPGWIPARESAAAPTLVLYDGACGFCHGWIRFLLAEDRAGVFRFAPLQGERAAAVLDDTRRAEVGDTVVAITPDGAVLSRSDAAIHIGARLGGLWRLATIVLARVPRGARDAAYDAVARVRHHLASPPSEACPILPPALRERFHG